MFLSQISFPFALYLEDEFTTFPDRDVLAHRLGRYRGFLQSRGVTRIVPKVKALEIPRQNRFRTWVEIVHQCDTIQMPDTRAAILYFRRGPHGPMMEMAHVLSRAQPEVRAGIPPQCRNA